MQERLNAEQKQVVTALTDVYEKAIENYRIQGKFDVILHSDEALSYDPASDIITQVLKEMDSMPIEFTPTKPETPAEKPAD